MSDPDERAPLFEPRPDDEQLTRAVKNLLGDNALEAWVGDMKIRLGREDKIEIDGARGLADLSDAEAHEILATSAQVTDAHMAEIAEHPDRLLDPRYNTWSPGNIVEIKTPGDRD